MRPRKSIEEELEERVRYFKSEDKLIWKHSVLQSARILILRCCVKPVFAAVLKIIRDIWQDWNPGLPPYTLMDYFPDEFLIIVDESHITIPQVRGMYAGDQSRKSTLVDYGFRLPSAKDNRPLNFEEFESKIDQMLFVSATPECV